MKAAFLALTALFVVGAPLTAAAQTADTVDGELHATLKNAEYVKVIVNGEDWENIEFENKGKVVIVKGLSTTIERNAVTLVPNQPGLQPTTVDLLQKEFKKKRKGREVYLVATRSVTFEKSTNPEPAPDKVPPAPKPDPVAPPEPQKDDL
ncbi:MAG: hypothetical protein JNJ59_05870 [Deltaproteobacteria bacterium]|jgi:hypothetical protein|nr:hypothetical protein [Deltaproteobacteria bacterium]